MPFSPQVLVLLLVAFELKQFIADFLLQSERTIAGKEHEHDWHAPLLAHAAAHGAITFVICLAFAPAFWWLGVVDLLLHAGIDRAKVLAVRVLGAKQGDRLWWKIFGADQAMHHLSHLAYSVIITLR
jgi:hypothetical protein